MKTSVNLESENEFPGLPIEILKHLKKAADKASIKRIAIVGGVLRDKIINQINHQPIKKFLDLDLVIEGSVDHFIEHIKTCR